MGKRAESSKELLQLERRDSPLENRLRVVQQSPGDGRKARTATASLPESSVLGRLKAFLPRMDEANQKLFCDIEEKGREQFDIEVVDDDASKPHIEMDLALGIADLNSPEAIAAAERAAAGQTLGRSPEDDGSDDSSDDDMGTDKESGKARSKPRKVKMIES